MIFLPSNAEWQVPRGSLGTLASLVEEGELEDLEAGVEHVPLTGKQRKKRDVNKKKTI